MKMLPRKKMAGMTLLELTVVLAILAIVTSIAVSSFAAVEDESRLIQTQNQFTQIETAILGEQNLKDSSGKLVVSGFVADVGRVPLAIDHDSNASTPLQAGELWANYKGLAGFALRKAVHLDAAHPTSHNNLTRVLKWNEVSGVYTTETLADTYADPSVLVPCGWRGNYLRMPVGNTRLFDGWGRDFLLTESDGTTLTAADAPITLIRSLGADGVVTVPPEESFNKELGFAFIAALVSGEVPITVVTPLATNVKQIRIYGPDGATGKVCCYFVDDLNVDTSTGYYRFRNVSIGPKVVRAYDTSGLPIGKVLNIVVKPGANTLETVEQ